MALYASGSPIANVTLAFTVDQWRISFNQVLADGVSTTANNTLQGTVTFQDSLTGTTAGFSGPVTAPIFTGNTVSATTLTGTLSTAAQPNITSVGTLTSLSTGTITGTDAGFSGLVTAPGVTANTLTGTLSTATQPNITSVGTLTSLSSTGTVDAAAFTGNLTGNVIGNLTGNVAATTVTANSLTLSTGATVTTVLDEDTMSSDSATALATQQSIKAYVDGATRFSVVNSNTALTAGSLIASNSTIAVTFTLPSTPTAGDSVTVSNQGTGTVTIGRNGENIKSLAEDGTLNAGTSTQLVYIDGAVGWGEL